MDDLLRQYYEKELGLLRRSIGTFATRHPKIATRLAISGDHSDDEHVERLLQSFALMAAHLDVKIENDYPEFTEPLLEVLYPQYLRAIPSCSIASFQIENAVDGLSRPVLVERGTELVGRTTEFCFRTVYDVTLSDLQITNAQYSNASLAPASTPLPPDTAGLLSLTFAMGAGGPIVRTQIPETVRIHIRGQQELVAALMDTVLVDGAVAFVETDNSGRWTRLSHFPVAAAGFDNEPLIRDASPRAFSLLTEYLIFPDKFSFVDIDFAALARRSEGSVQLNLHLALRKGHRPNQSTLDLTSADNFKLHCTPVINLFRQKAVPINIDGRTSAYQVLPKTRDSSQFAVYSVDTVRAAGKTLNDALLPPHHALTNDDAVSQRLPRWVMSETATKPGQATNYETLLSIVDPDGYPVAPDTDQLILELTCSNGELPRAMPFGNPAGDLTNEKASLPCRISLLARPTSSIRLPRREGAMWRLIEFLTPHPLQISGEGLGELKRLFRQYSNGTHSHLRYLDGVISLTLQPSVRWMPVKPSPQFVRGLEVRLTVDEDAFAAHSVATFVAVMDRFFARYAAENSFVQLVVVSQSTGEEIVRCPSRDGTTPLA